MKPCKQWDIYHINWLAGFLNHQQHGKKNRYVQHQRGWTTEGDVRVDGHPWNGTSYFQHCVCLGWWDSCFLWTGGHLNVRLIVSNKMCQFIFLDIFSFFLIYLESGKKVLHHCQEYLLRLCSFLVLGKKERERKGTCTILSTCLSYVFERVVFNKIQMLLRRWHI